MIRMQNLSDIVLCISVSVYNVNQQFIFAVNSIRSVATACYHMKQPFETDTLLQRTKRLHQYQRLPTMPYM